MEDHETEPQLRWSSSFNIAAPSTATSKNVRGDKILLPQSALEQLLAAAPSTTPSQSFVRHDPFNMYSNAYAQPSYRETSQLPNPLMFRLVNPTNSNTVYAGIREFSAEEGEVVMGTYLMEALGITLSDFGADGSAKEPVDLTQEMEVDTQPRVTIHAEQLPKGTYVRLRPLEAGYNPDDWKPLLERQLRESYTTLTKDSVLSVRGVKGEEYRFLLDKFLPEGNGICVVDTDLEVDIEALNEEQARESLRQIMAKSQPGTADGSSKGGDIDIWKAVQGQVLPGEYVDYKLPSWDRSNPLTVELSGISEPETVDIFISPRSTRQRALPRDHEHVLGNFSLAKDGAKSIIIQPTNIELEGAEELFISVHGFPTEASNVTPVTFTLSARSGVPGDANATATQPGVSEEHSPEDEQCKNCLQWIPKRTMFLHQNFCLRNNIVCPKCKSVFKKGSQEWEDHWHCDFDDEYGDSAASKAKHDTVRHTERACPTCDMTLPSLVELALHKTSVCPGKLILCKFCHLEVPQEGDPVNPSAEVLLSGLTEHELADGARTTNCHLCDKIVRLRDMAAHIKHHELDKVSRQKPDVCRNLNCGRTLHGVGANGAVGAGTRMGQGPGNELGLCSLCFGPLYVSMHDPEGKALRRRIERKYLSQLMTGCKKAWCANEWCKTGRANLGLDPMGSSSQTAMPAVKPLVEAVPNLSEPMHFCVDEGSQKRRKLAEMLAGENVFDLEWCIAACEAGSGDLDKAREWLQNWAPTKV